MKKEVNQKSKRKSERNLIGASKANSKGKLKTSVKKAAFIRGLKDGVPIGLGYFAVSFTLGITAVNIGMTPVQAMIMSFLLHASAGEFAVLNVIAGAEGYLAMVFTQIVVNMRYILMSCSLSQKIHSKTPYRHRFLLSYFVTDELFGISSAVKGNLNPYYTYGAISVASPGWGIGTLLGALLGNVLPVRLAGAMNIALYGMFLAIIIPPAKENKVIRNIVIASMGGSLLFSVVPFLQNIESGFRIIILTIIIASVAAYLHPVAIPGEEGVEPTATKQKQNGGNDGA